MGVSFLDGVQKGRTGHILPEIGLFQGVKGFGTLVASKGHQPHECGFNKAIQPPRRVDKRRG
ncbi:hypothetical protein LJB81_04725, partial [Desulfovibrio sp. OttesenSCG-928-M14]|nr:hypothetical protein [Desulfovibrio sp. OttesenSCG-928-M14]